MNLLIVSGWIGSTGGGGAAPNANTLRVPPFISASFNLASSSSRNVGSILLTSVPSFSLSDGRKSSMRAFCLRDVLGTAAGAVGIPFKGTGSRPPERWPSSARASTTK